MYEKFYGLKEKPFSLLPDPAFLYPSKKHRLALTMLEYGLVNQAAISVISGDIGSGKTTLIRQLLNQIDEDVTVGLISNTHASFGELLQWVLLAFDLDYRNRQKVELYQAFFDFLVLEYSKGRRTVLIVDEAQNLDLDALEELRMLSNINADKDQVLQLILVGQPELRKKLQMPGLTQFAQRIAVDYHLEPLNLEETHHYIRHRMTVAGGDPDLFGEGARKLVYHHSRGIPRLINILCDTTLVYAYAEGLREINGILVNKVAVDKQKGGFFPSPELPATDTDAAAPARREPEAVARD